MARFCGNCGYSLDADARVCGRCGTPVNSGANINMPGTPKKTKKASKIIKLVAAAAIVIVAAIVAINIVVANTGYNGLIKKTMKAYKTYDIDALVDMSSDAYYYSADDELAERYFENAVGKDIDMFEESVGHNYSLSYETDEVYTLSERRFNELIDQLSVQFDDFDTDVVEKAVAAEIEVEVKQDKKTLEKKLTLTMTKENGTWKLLKIE